MLRDDLARATGVSRAAADADDLFKQFPDYEREIVRDYSKSDPFGRDTYRARLGYPANSVLPLNRFSR